MRADGDLSQAAHHLIGRKIPAGLVQSYCFSAGMLDLAILMKKPGTRLPIYLREAYQASYRKPRMIVPSAKILRNMAYHYQHRPEAASDPNSEEKS